VGFIYSGTIEAGMAEADPSPNPLSWRKWFRPQDLAWLILIAALGLAGHVPSDAEIELLSLLAFLQFAEPRIAWLHTRRGRVLSIFTKLLLSYLLIGVTGGLNSSYYLILMIPVVSAATTLGLAGTVFFSLLAAGSYLSFLLFLDWNVHVIPPDQVRELCLRVLMLGLMALLTHQLAAASRQQSSRIEETARQLADANRSLQEAEAAVRRSERLAALGQLTAGLAHELRNPLGTMRASADVLLNNIEPQQKVARELAGYISSEVDRTNSLITRFLDFARPLELRPADSDLPALLDRSIDQVQRHPSANGITIIRNYAPDASRAWLDSELMERVFYNLILNAVQASRSGGAVTVKSKAMAGGVEVAVIDRGAGIEPAQRENIFNPFFTTKPDGVGLGLAIVSKIVDQHGGTMAVESEPGQGSVFRVLLPER
jgi:signal transduction histidine kinase